MLLNRKRTIWTRDTPGLLSQSNPNTANYSSGCHKLWIFPHSTEQSLYTLSFLYFCLLKWQWNINYQKYFPKYSTCSLRSHKEYPPPSNSLARLPEHLGANGASLLPRSPGCEEAFYLYGQPRYSLMPESSGTSMSCPYALKRPKSHEFPSLHMVNFLPLVSFLITHR